MSKLPVCPHCKTVYSYREVKENNKKKVIKCYHCKKEFHNGRKGLIFLAALVCVIASVINVFILNTSSEKFISIIPISVISIIAVLMGLIMFPFFISYKK